VSQIDIFSSLYVHLAELSNVTGIDKDFIPLPLKAMRNLQGVNRSNMVYGLIKSVSLPNAVGNLTKLPLNRMPTGWLHRASNQLFDANQMSSVTIPQLLMSITFVRALVLL
jgi:spore maturation protein SpmA